MMNMFEMMNTFVRQTYVCHLGDKADEAYICHFDEVVNLSYRWQFCYEVDGNPDDSFTIKVDSQE
jgi:hypothetical protein